MKKEGAVPVRRLLAFATDGGVVLLWGGVLFGAVMIATGGDPPRPKSPWTAQAIGFSTMTLPAALYLALCESSRWQASVGKRMLGLVVSRIGGARLSCGRALLRNAVKFVPWEAGHMVAHQAAYSGDNGFPGWAWGPAAVALLGPLCWIMALVATGRTPYDRWAGAQVARSVDPARRR